LGLYVRSCSLRTEVHIKAEKPPYIRGKESKDIHALESAIRKRFNFTAGFLICGVARIKLLEKALLAYLQADKLRLVAKTLEKSPKKVGINIDS